MKLVTVAAARHLHHNDDIVDKHEPGDKRAELVRGEPGAESMGVSKERRLIGVC